MGYSRPNKYPRGANLDFQGDDLLLAHVHDVCLNITQLALLIIGKCGFGFQFSWAEPARTADGRMAVQEALRISADSFKVSLFVPWWLKLLPLKRSVGNIFNGVAGANLCTMSSRFKEVAEATSELLAFMQAQVAERKADIRARGSARRDAFSMLVEASEKETEKYKMDDSEIVRIDNFCLESNNYLTTFS